MYIPGARERVEVANRQGVFLVIYVDREKQSADVVALNDRSYVADNVPFVLLRPYKPTLALETN